MVTLHAVVVSLQCFGQPDARTAILDFDLFQKATCLQNLYRNILWSLALKKISTMSQSFRGQKGTIFV